MPFWINKFINLPSKEILMHNDLSCDQKTAVLRAKIKRLAAFPNRKIRQNFNTDI